MSHIAIVETPRTAALPDPVVRADLAWPRFLPRIEPGTLPGGGGDALLPLARWFWEAMGQVAGFNRTDGAETVYVATPRLSPNAREFLLRLASFWADRVYLVAEGEAVPETFEALPNAWRPPVHNLHAAVEAGSVSDSATVRLPEGEDRFLTPIMGIGRAFMKVQVVRPGTASARLHSHSAIDECYIVLEGRATLRIAGHTVAVGPGDLIAKPTGPDLATHLAADQDEPVVLLDIEVWPDARIAAGTKDVGAYPDHQELFLHGPGWRAMVPMAAMDGVDDAAAHYQDGYVRTRDGGTVPQDFPGHPRRTDS